jgi:hypothetical protein
MGSENAKKFFEVSSRDLENITLPNSREESGMQKQNFLNSSQTKAFKISGNEPRIYFSSTNKIRDKRVRQKSREDLGDNRMALNEYDADIQRLIRGYISRSKKSWSRGRK